MQRNKKERTFALLMLRAGAVNGFPWAPTFDPTWWNRIGLFLRRKSAVAWQNRTI
jgi:hypothetical protein